VGFSTENKKILKNPKNKKRARLLPGELLKNLKSEKE
jgi:hypothetical protein